MVLLLAFLACLVVAGGASRADVLGQAIVRAAAGFVIAALIVAGTPIRRHEFRTPILLLLATILLPLLQLVPLPPWLWTHLPGHGLAAATRSGSRPATTSEVRPPMQ